MSTLQTTLYFIVTVVAAVVLAYNLSDIGTYKFKMDTDWVVFTFVLAWEAAAIVLVWTLIK